MDKNKLREYGVDYDKGLKNCLGNLSFYKRILTLFLHDTSYTRALHAYDDKDYQSLFSCIHEMKGFTGNAAFVGLYAACCALVEELRGQTYREGEIAILFTNVKKAYAATHEAVQMILEE